MSYSSACLHALEKYGYVLAHIDGPQGSGKTTLINKLKEKHPSLIVKDLDDFASIAKDRAGLSNKSSWQFLEHDTLRLNREKQKIIDRFIYKNKNKPTLLAGIHMDPPGHVNVPGKKILLDTPPFLSAWRKYRKAKKDKTASPVHLIDVPFLYQTAYKDRTRLNRRGYVNMKPKQITQFIDNALLSAKSRPV